MSYDLFYFYECYCYSFIKLFISYLVDFFFFNLNFFFFFFFFLIQTIFHRDEREKKFKSFTIFYKSKKDKKLFNFNGKFLFIYKLII